MAPAGTYRERESERPFRLRYWEDAKRAILMYRLILQCKCSDAAMTFSPCASGVRTHPFVQCIPR
jgi:hypothetical protein